MSMPTTKQKVLCVGGWNTEGEAGGGKEQKGERGDAQDASAVDAWLVIMSLDKVPGCRPCDSGDYVSDSVGCVIECSERGSSAPTCSREVYQRVAAGTCISDLRP